MRHTLAALADLVFSSRCLICSMPTDGPAMAVCGPCRAPWQVQPTLVSGSPKIFAIRPYDRLAQQMILAVKEDARRAAEPVLAEAIAIAALPLLAEVSGPVLLVSVPSRAAARRRRGADVLWSITRQAADLLAGAEWPVSAQRLLRHQRTVSDQSTLDARGRQTNIAHSMCVRTTAFLRGRTPSLGIMGRTRIPPGPVIVLDDLVTTGATMKEAFRALHAGGFQVLGGASAASTALHTERRASWQ